MCCSCSLDQLPPTFTGSTNFTALASWFTGCHRGRNITKLHPLTLHLHHGFCMFLYVFIPDWETFWSNTIATEKRCLFEDGITPHRLNAAGCPHASSAELFPFPFAGPFPFPFAAPLAAGTCHANCNTIPCHSCPLQILLHKLIALPASAGSLASSATSAFTSLTSFVSGLAAGTSAAFGSSADGAASRPKQLPSIIKHEVCQASLQWYQVPLPWCLIYPGCV